MKLGGTMRSGYTQPANWRSTKARILKRDGGLCYQCGKPASEVDHVIPVARGGTHDDDNLAAICTPHHEAKSEQERRQGYQLRRATHSRQREPEQHPSRI